MKQAGRDAAAAPLRPTQCPACRRVIPRLTKLVCEDCARKLNQIRKEASALKTSGGRPAARPADARPRGGEADGERDTLSAFSWFEMVCFGGGIAIWIGYLTSEFYFTLAVVIVMALAVIALLIEGIIIR